MNKPKVAFVCVHNSCRSQMAEAISRIIASDIYDAFSAGTETAPEINPDAVRAIKTLYQTDMSASQYPKLISTLPPVDIVITMGCNVKCPFLPCKYREDWGIEDPTGKSDAEFLETARIIEAKIREFMQKV